MVFEKQLDETGQVGGAWGQSEKKEMKTNRVVLICPPFLLLFVSPPLFFLPQHARRVPATFSFVLTPKLELAIGWRCGSEKTEDDCRSSPAFASARPMDMYVVPISQT